MPDLATLLSTRSTQAADVDAKLSDPIPSTTDLAAAAAAIADEHRLARAAACSALSHARRAGELLLDAKARLPHGAWLPWVQSLDDLSPRTAQAYMRLAAHWSEVKAKAQHVAHLPLRQALRLLAEPRTAEAQPEDVAPIEASGSDCSLAVVAAPKTRVERHPVHYRKRYANANKMMERMVRNLAGIALAAKQILDVSQLDPSRRADWLKSLRESSMVFNGICKKLKEEDKSS